MNISLKKLTQYFSYGTDPRPVRDWFVLLRLFVLAIIIIACVDGWTFWQIRNGAAFSANEVIPPQAVDFNAITAVQQVFDTRATEQDRYEHTYHFVDPSK